MKLRTPIYVCVGLLALVLNGSAIAAETIRPLSDDQLIYGDKRDCYKERGLESPEDCYVRKLEIEHQRVEELVARITSMLKDGADYVYPFPAKDAKGKRDQERERLEFDKELRTFVANHERWKTYRETLCRTLMSRSSGKGSASGRLEAICRLEVNRGYSVALLAVYSTYVRRIL